MNPYIEAARALLEVLIMLVPNASERQRLITEAEARAANAVAKAYEESKFHGGPFGGTDE